MAERLEMPNKDMNGNMDEKPEMLNENSSEKTETISKKAIKASSNIIIEGGNIKIDSCDDSIHSNNIIKINGGVMNIASGEDGIHSDSELTINGGNIKLSKSYEGIESETININNGNIHIAASDDGVNVSEVNSESSIGTNPGQHGSNTSLKAQININGGYVYVDSNGDGIDSNGNVNMKDGTVIVNGPISNGNGSLDYDGTFDISGGTLIAAGSVGMAQTPSGSSSQKTINISLTSQEANTIVNVQSEDGKDILTFAPTKAYQSMVVSTPNIKSNEKYYVSIGGSSTAKSTDGLYSGGKYSGGTKIGTEKVSDIITNITQDGATTAGSMGGPGGKSGLGGQETQQ
jgi:hypothetical protein